MIEDCPEVDREKKNPDLHDYRPEPSPEEVQREIEAAMREKFGDKIKIYAQQMPTFAQEGSDSSSKPADDVDANKTFDLIFNYRPKQIKTYLDRYVIKQDEAKKALAIAVCDHYNHVRNCHQANLRGEVMPDDNYAKQNVLMLGPTGVGKTYLVRMIAKLIGVPFVKADATRFTEVGYVGANVDDMVRDLVAIAGGNIALAQYGIIYLDEADKLAGSNNVASKDISGRGVQYGLLKLMEETEIDLRAAHDMISQIQAFMDFQKQGKVSKKVINTKHILFIVSGAFSGLEEIIKKRTKVKAIGLKIPSENLTGPRVGNTLVEEDWFAATTTKDLIDFGFEPEFVGRLPIRLSCHQLTDKDLFQILKNSEGSILHQYIDAFRAYGIDIYFQDAALMAIAELASEEKTGARGLMTVFEKIFRHYKYELPSTTIRAFLVTPQLVSAPDQELEKMLADPNYAIFPVFAHLVQEQENQLMAKEGLEVIFTEDATRMLYNKAKDENLDVPTLCQIVWDELLYGLKMLQKTSGMGRFTLDGRAITHSRDYLEQLIRECGNLAVDKKGH